MSKFGRNRRDNKYMGGSMKFKSVKECQVLAFYLQGAVDTAAKSGELQPITCKDDDGGSVCIGCSIIPTGEGIRSLLRGYFPSCTFTEGQLRDLDRCGTVTPGDFGVLAGKVRFMDGEDLDADFVTGELLKIQEEKQSSSCGGHVIGFSGAA